MKKTKLSRQFLLNYIFIFVILVVMISIIFFFNTAYLNAVQTFDVDFDQVESDYYNYNLETALSNQNLEPEDQLLILSTDLEVIASTTADLPVGMKLDNRTYNAYFMDHMDYDHLISYMTSDEDQFFILRFYRYSNYMDILFPLGLIFTGVFVLFTLQFARASSSKLVNPLDQLRKGVQAIQAGDLDHVIAFTANNELDDLKDHINSLSKALQTEIYLRKQVEANRQALIRNVSHDIRTPLTNIIGYSDTLLDLKHPMTPEESKKALQSIHHYGQMANQLVDELFELSSLELDQNIQYPIGDLSECLRLKVIDYWDEFELKGITCQLDLGHHPLWVGFDEKGIHRVLDNLIQNSLKYNQSDFDIRLILTPLQDGVQLIYEDNGIGIPEAYYETIFNPMVRVDLSRNQNIPGTGLGLTIARKIVENHKGTIRLDHTESGVRFVIQIKNAA